MKKTYEELERELRERINEINKKDDLIENLERNISRTRFILSEWIDDYSFSKKPDPFKAIAWATGKGEGVEYTQSSKWFWEYNQIHELIEICIDYTDHSINLIDSFKEAE